MSSGVHVEGGEERGISEAARGRRLGKEDIEQVVLIGSADTLREREREAQSLGSAQASNSRGHGEAHLELEQFLKVGKGLARHEQEIMSDEFFRRIFRAHDDLEQGIDVLHVPRDVARVSDRATRTWSVSSRRIGV